MAAQNKTKESTLKNEKTVYHTSPAAQKATVLPVPKPEPLKTLHTWKALDRPFKQRSRDYFTTVGAIAFLLVIILMLLKEWLLIVVIMALAFYAYVMATIKPQQVEHTITNRGIKVGNRTYIWTELGRFWFTQKHGQKILHVENLEGLPHQLILMVGDTDQANLTKVLAEYLPQEEPEKTWTDNASAWLSRHIPLEKAK